jgi:hypothetical protein
VGRLGHGGGAVTGVTGAAAGVGLVSDGVAQARLRLLVAAGWQRAELARRLGMPSRSLSAVMRRDRVLVRTAAAVDALCCELAGLAPPPPRLPAGRRRAGELVAEAEEMARYGVGRSEAARRLGVSRAALDQAYSRHFRRLAGSDPTSEETIMIMDGSLRRKPLRGRLLVEECDELARYGVDTYAGLAERTGASISAIKQAYTRRNRVLAKAAAAAARPAQTAEVAPLALALASDPGRRAGCGTILALLLHQALGEEVCGDCLANAAGRGYRIRVAGGGRLAA